MLPVLKIETSHEPPLLHVGHATYSDILDEAFQLKFPIGSHVCAMYSQFRKIIPPDKRTESRREQWQ